MTAPLVQATGRRKRAVARVRFAPGDGTVVVNGVSALDYFPTRAQAEAAIAPLAATETEGVYNVEATITGGGNGNSRSKGLLVSSKNRIKPRFSKLITPSTLARNASG